MLSSQLITTSDLRLAHKTSGLEPLLRILAEEPGNYTRYVPIRDSLPAPKLIRQITGAANGTCDTPPRVQISTAYGVLKLEAKWLVPAGTLPEDAAKYPKSCLIAVTIPKPVIADELGIQISSVADLTKKLYQTLDILNSAELGAKIWLGQKQAEVRQNSRLPDELEFGSTVFRASLSHYYITKISTIYMF